MPQDISTPLPIKCIAIFLLTVYPSVGVFLVSGVMPLDDYEKI